MQQIIELITVINNEQSYLGLQELEKQINKITNIDIKVNPIETQSVEKSVKQLNNLLRNPLTIQTNESNISKLNNELIDLRENFHKTQKLFNNNLIKLNIESYYSSKYRNKKKSPIENILGRKNNKFLDLTLDNIFGAVKNIEKAIGGGSRLPDNISSRGLTLIAEKLGEKKELNKYVKEKRYEMPIIDAKKEFLGKVPQRKIDEAMKGISPRLLYKNRSLTPIYNEKPIDSPVEKIKTPKTEKITFKNDCCDILANYFKELNSLLDVKLSTIIKLLDSIKNNTNKPEEKNIIQTGIDNIVSSVASNLGDSIATEIKKAGLPIIKTAGLDVISKIKAIKSVNDNAFMALIKRLSPLGLTPTAIGADIVSMIPDELINTLEKQLTELGMSEDEQTIAVLEQINSSILQLIDTTQQSGESNIFGDLFKSAINSIGGNIGNEISQGFKESLGGQNLFTLLKNYATKMLPSLGISGFKLKGSTDNLINQIQSSNIAGLLSGKTDNLAESLDLISEGVNLDGIQQVLSELDLENLDPESLIVSLDKLTSQIDSGLILEGIDNVDLSLPDNLTELATVDIDSLQQPIKDLGQTLQETGQYLGDESGKQFDKAFTEGAKLDYAGQSLESSIFEEINKNIIKLVQETKKSESQKLNIFEGVFDNVKERLFSDIGGFAYGKSKNFLGSIGGQILNSLTQRNVANNAIITPTSAMTVFNPNDSQNQILNQLKSFFTSDIIDVDSSVVDGNAEIIIPKLEEIKNELTPLKLLPQLIQNQQQSLQSPKEKLSESKKEELSYKELKTQLKEYKKKGLTDVKLNSPKKVLQSEFDRIKTVESQKQTKVNNVSPTPDINLEQPLTSIENFAEKISDIARILDIKTVYQSDKLTEVLNNISLNNFGRLENRNYLDIEEIFDTFLNPDNFKVPELSYGEKSDRVDIEKLTALLPQWEAIKKNHTLEMNERKKLAEQRRLQEQKLENERRKKEKYQNQKALLESTPLSGFVVQEGKGKERKGYQRATIQFPLQNHSMAEKQGIKVGDYLVEKGQFTHIPSGVGFFGGDLERRLGASLKEDDYIRMAEKLTANKTLPFQSIQELDYQGKERPIPIGQIEQAIKLSYTGEDDNKLAEISTEINVRWEKAKEEIKQVISELEEFSAEKGYQIQRNLSSGSPGLLTEILKRWNKATTSINSVYSVWVRSSVEAGKSIYRSFNTAINSVGNVTDNVIDDFDLLSIRFTDAMRDIQSAMNTVGEGELFYGTEEAINAVTDAMRDLSSFSEDTANNLGIIGNHIENSAERMTEAVNKVGRSTESRFRREFNIPNQPPEPEPIETERPTPQQSEFNQTVGFWGGVLSGVRNLFTDINTITEEGVRQFNEDLENGFESSGSVLLDAFGFYSRIDDSESAFMRRLNSRSQSAGQLAQNLMDVQRVWSSIALVQMAWEPLKNAITYSTDLYLQLEKVKITLRDVGKTGNYSALSDLRKLTKDLGINFLQAAKGYAAFRQSVIGSKLESQSKPIFEKLLVSMSASGLATDAQERAFLAISQMASKGRVSLEELTGQLSEALPGALSVASRSMGMTNQELIKMVENGNVLAETLLPRLATQFESESFISLIQSQNSLSTSFNKLENAVQDVGLSFGENFAPFIKITVDGLTQLTNFIKGNLSIAIMGTTALFWNFLETFFPSATRLIAQVVSLKNVIKFLGIESVVTTFKMQGFNAGMIASGKLLKAYIGTAFKFLIIPSLIEGVISQFYGMATAGDETLKGLSKGLNSFVNDFESSLGRIKENTKNPIEIKIIESYQQNLPKEKPKKQRRKQELSDFFGQLSSGIFEDFVGTTLSPFIDPEIDRSRYSGITKENGRKMRGLQRSSQVGLEYTTRTGEIERDYFITPKQYKQMIEDYKNIETIITESQKLKEGTTATVLNTDFLKNSVNLIQGKKEAIAEVQVKLIKAKESNQFDLVEELTKTESQLNTELNNIFEERFKGANNLQKTVDTLKETRDFLIAPDSEKMLGISWSEIQKIIANIDKELIDLQPSLAKYNQAIKAIDTTLGMIANKSYQINLQFNNELQGINTENITKQIDIYSQKLNKEISSKELGIKEAILNVDINQKTVSNLQSKLDKLGEEFNLEIKSPLVLQEFGLEKGSTINDLIKSGISTESLDLFITKYQDELSKTLGLKESLESAKDYINTATEYNNSQKSLIDSQINLVDAQKQQRLDARDFTRQLVDFDLQVKDYFINRSRQLQDFEKNFTDASIQNQRGARDLVESFRDLRNTLNTNIKNINNQLITAKNQLSNLSDFNEIRGNFKLGSNGLLNQFTTLLEGIFTSEESLNEQTRNLEEERLALQQETTDYARQIRGLGEQAYDLERDRFNQLIDLTRQQDDFIKEQNNSWRDITKTAEDLAETAKEWGIQFTSIADILINITGMYERLQSKINDSVNNMQTATSVLPYADSVKVGKLGSTGSSTAPHLHFEVIAPSGQALNPKNTDYYNKVMIGNTAINQMGINSGHGMRKHPIKGVQKFHAGIDVGGQNNLGQNITLNIPTSEIKKIEQKNDVGGYGKYTDVTLMNDYKLRFAHLLEHGKQLTEITSNLTKTTNNFNGNDAKSIASAFIKQEEGFRDKAYFDVNRYRVGYGTEFKGNSPNSYRASSTITRAEADNQLENYDIPRFTSIIKGQLGDTFNQLSEQIKASLISVSYNYGSLPSKVVNAVKTKNTATIANSIRTLKANPERRNREADLVLLSSQNKIKGVTPNDRITNQHSNLPLVSSRNSVSNISSSSEFKSVEKQIKEVITTFPDTVNKAIANVDRPTVKSLIEFLDKGQKIPTDLLREVLNLKDMGNYEGAIKILETQVKNFSQLKSEFIDTKQKQIEEQRIFEEFQKAQELRQNIITVGETVRNIENNYTQLEQSIKQAQIEAQGFTTTQQSLDIAVAETKNKYRDLRQQVRSFGQEIENSLDVISLDNLDKAKEELTLLKDKLALNLSIIPDGSAKEKMQEFIGLIEKGLAENVNATELLITLKAEFDKLGLDKQINQVEKEAEINIRVKTNYESLTNFNSELSGLYSTITTDLKELNMVNTATNFEISSRKLGSINKYNRAIYESELIIKRLNKEIAENPANKEYLEAELEQAIKFQETATKIKDIEEIRIPIIVETQNSIDNLNKLSNFFKLIGEIKAEIDPFFGGNKEKYISGLLDLNAKYKQLELDIQTLANSEQSLFSTEQLKVYSEELQKLREKDLKLLNIKLSPVGQVLYEPLQQGIKESVSELIRGTKSMREIIGGLVDNITSRFTDMFANLVAQGIFELFMPNANPFNTNNQQEIATNLALTGFTEFESAISLFGDSVANNAVNFGNILSTGANSFSNAITNSTDILSSSLGNFLNGILSGGGGSGLFGTLASSALSGITGGIVPSFGGGNYSFAEGIKLKGYSMGGKVEKLPMISNFSMGGKVPEVMIPNFSMGGEIMPQIENFSDGGQVKALSLGLGMIEAMKREGANAVPVVAYAGESFLSHKTGDAQLYEDLKRTGVWDMFKHNPSDIPDVKNYEYGGTVERTYSKMTNNSSTNTYNNSRSKETNNNSVKEKTIIMMPIEQSKFIGSPSYLRQKEKLSR